MAADWSSDERLATAANWGVPVNTLMRGHGRGAHRRARCASGLSTSAYGGGAPVARPTRRAAQGVAAYWSERPRPYPGQGEAALDRWVSGLVGPLVPPGGPAEHPNQARNEEPADA